MKSTITGIDVAHTESANQVKTAISSTCHVQRHVRFTGINNRFSHFAASILLGICHRQIRAQYPNEFFNWTEANVTFPFLRFDLFIN